jgi:hypothetical protein
MSKPEELESKFMFKNPCLQPGAVVGVRLKSGDTFVGVFQKQNKGNCDIIPLGMRGAITVPKNIIEILLVSITSGEEPYVEKN